MNWGGGKLVVVVPACAGMTGRGQEQRRGAGLALTVEWAVGAGAAVVAGS